MGNSNIWDSEWEVSEELAKQLITSQFPQLASKTIQEIGHGWDNTVYLIGKEYAFRFPRRKVAINALRIEGKILPKLVDYISIAYSMPLFYGEGDYDYPAPFLGYTYLSGEFPIGLTDEQRALSAITLAKFLKSLHAFPVDVAQEMGVQYDHRNLTDMTMLKEKMQKFVSVIEPYLNKEEYRIISDYLKQLKTKKVKQKSVFLHGDLHFKNMLADENGIISGIIDWGDVSIGHPASDLNIAYCFLPPHARLNFFEEYGEVDEETKVLARLIAIFIPTLIFMQAIEEKNELLIDEAKGNIYRALAD